VSSERQIEANKINAQRSTGPRTPEGKQRVASNALKHGLTGKQIVLPNENSDEFDEFRNAIWNDLCPQGAFEEVLADKIVADAWRLKRVPVLQAAIHERRQKHSVVSRLQSRANSFQKVVYEPGLFEEPFANSFPRERTVIEDPDGHAKALAELEDASHKLSGDLTLQVLQVLEACADELDNLSRHEEALAKSMFRTLHELQRLQALRAGEPVVAPAALDVDVNVSQPSR
jgi:hypothetical protein